MGKKPFRFSTKQAARVPVEVVRAEMLIPQPSPMYIHGRPAGSSLEWNVAQALDILQVPFQYQVEVGYGRLRRGGRVLDFVAYTPIRPTVITVMGRYWHTGRHNDELEIQDIKRLTHYQMDVIIIWEENALTVNDAVQFLRQALHLG